MIGIEYVATCSDPQISVIIYEFISGELLLGIDEVTT